MSVTPQSEMSSFAVARAIDGALMPLMRDCRRTINTREVSRRRLRARQRLMLPSAIISGVKFGFHRDYPRQSPRWPLSRRDAPPKIRLLAMMISSMMAPKFCSEPPMILLADHRLGDYCDSSRYRRAIHGRRLAWRMMLGKSHSSAKIYAIRERLMTIYYAPPPACRRDIRRCGSLVSLERVGCTLYFQCPAIRAIS